MPRSFVRSAVVVSAGVLISSSVLSAPASADTSQAALPTVTSVSPGRASAGGFQPVLIRGTHLTGATAVLFGAHPAESFEVQSARAVLAIAPAVPPGRRTHVQVQTPAGTSAQSPNDRITFLAPAPAHAANIPVGGPAYGDAYVLDCPAAGWCAAGDMLGGDEPVAFSVIEGGTAQTLAIPLPAGSNPRDAALFAVSCSAVNACIAVGDRDYKIGAMVATLHSGSVTSVPIDGVAGFPRSALEDASCDRAVCVAVGEDYNDSKGTSRSLILERGSDRSWAPVPAPREKFLLDVSCAGTTCVALGPTYAPALLVRTAAGWQETRAAAPAPGQTAELTAVNCYRQDACVAYGSFRDTNGLQHPLFERWDGTAWTAYPVERPVTLDNDFIPGPLDCTGSGTCYAAGDSTIYFHATAFVARLSGTRTSVSALPVRTDRGPVVGTSSVDLACASASFCVLGSSYQTHDPQFGQVYYDTYVLSNGVWTNEASPRSYAASCAPPNFCGLAGVDGSGGIVRTIEQRY